MTAEPTGCWVACNSGRDPLPVSVHATEVEALRHAVRFTLDTVKFVKWGEDAA
jgi:hypothetical protein